MILTYTLPFAAPSWAGCGVSRRNPANGSRRVGAMQANPALARANLGYSRQVQEYSDHEAELRKHPQITSGARVTRDQRHERAVRAELAASRSELRCQAIVTRGAEHAGHRQGYV